MNAGFRPMVKAENLSLNQQVSVNRLMIAGHFWV